MQKEVNNWWTQTSAYNLMQKYILGKYTETFILTILGKYSIMQSKLLLSIVSWSSVGFVCQ